MAGLPLRRIGSALQRTQLTWPALLVFFAASLPEPLQAWLAWERQAILAGEVWRLWSGHFVHYGAPHALSNGLSLLVLGICLPHVTGRAIARCLLLAPVLISLALLALAPQLATYRGASGLVALLLTMLAVSALRTVRQRLWGGLLLAALAVKLTLEALGLAIGTSLPDTVAVVWQAHAAAALLGLLWVVLTPGPWPEPKN